MLLSPLGLQVDRGIKHWSILKFFTHIKAKLTEIHSRPHQTHEMLTIAIDDRVAWASVNLSVTQATVVLTHTLRYYYTTMLNLYAGADPGGPPIFGKVNFIFLHCIQCMKKIFLKLNFDFRPIVAEIRVFGSVGVYVCVSVWSHRPTRQISRFLSNIGGFRNRGRYCFCSAKAQFWMISDAILIPKIYARLQEIASVRAFAPLPGPPFQNFWIRPWYVRVKHF